MALSSILHLVHPFGGGTMEHIKHLQLLFPSFQHCVVHTLEAANGFFRDNPFDMDTKSGKPTCKLFHIHAMVNENPCDALTTLAQWVRRTLDIPIVITVHDYQWLFGLGDPSPSKELFDQRHPDSTNPFQRASRRLFDTADTILYPSVAVLENYQRYLPHPNAILAPHNDTSVYPARICIPPIQNRTVHVAYVGHFQELKGARFFIELAATLRDVSPYQLQYHAIGGNVPSNAHVFAPIITFHGAYQEHELHGILDRLGIHILVMLSQAQETYSYVLTKAINSGRAIVYIPRGSFVSRLNPNHYERYVPAQNTLPGIQDAILRALQWVLKHAGQQDALPEDVHVIRKAPWYEQHYPPDIRTRNASQILL